MKRYYFFDFPVDLMAVVLGFLLLLAAIYFISRRGTRP